MKQMNAFKFIFNKNCRYVYVPLALIKINDPFWNQSLHVLYSQCRLNYSHTAAVTNFITFALLCPEQN